VSFRNLKVDISNSPEKGSTRKSGVTVGLISVEKFNTAIDAKHFCGEEGKLILQHGFKEKGRTVQIVDVPADAPKTKDVPLPEEKGSYYLVVANCDPRIEGTLGGSVLVKSSHGYLPGNEVHRKTFYGWMALCYFLFSGFWGSVLLRYYKGGLLLIQWSVLAVVVSGFIEALVWWIVLDLWNRVGQTAEYLGCAAEALTVLKYSSSLLFLVLASDGWGVTKDDALGDKSVTSVVASVIIFSSALLAFARESIVRQRHFYQIPAMPYLGPVVIFTIMLYAGLCAWMLSKLSRFASEAQQHQLEKLNGLLRGVGMTVKVALLMFGFVAGFHLMDIFGFSTISWSVHFAVTDGLQQGIFTLMLAAIMFILWPEPDEGGVYAATAQDEKDVETSHIIGDEDIDPDVIGARAAGIE